MRYAGRSFLLAGAFALTTVAAAAAQTVAVAGTSARLEPPAGFEPTDRFPGFVDPKTGASLMVTELRAPLAEMRAAMTADQLATRAITWISSETVQGASGEVLLVGASQSAAGVAYRKWLALSGEPAQPGEPERVLMVVATWPADSSGLAEPMRAAVLSASLSGEAPGLFDGLPFTLTESGSLKIAQRVSNALMVNEGGRQRILAPGEPLFVAAASISGVDLDDLGAFADGRLRQTEQLIGPWEASGKGLEVGGLPAWEIEASATDKKAGIPLRVYQLIVQDGPRNYLIAQAMVAPERWDEMLPQFRAVARSLRKAP
jgi:hypothetical protein